MRILTRTFTGMALALTCLHATAQEEVIEPTVTLGEVEIVRPETVFYGDLSST